MKPMGLVNGRRRFGPGFRGSAFRLALGVVCDRGGWQGKRFHNCPQSWPRSRRHHCDMGRYLAWGCSR